MKKMEITSQKNTNGGCEHYAVLNIYSRRWAGWSPITGTKYRYRWLCGKCGRQFNTYAYF
jgi:hypothetical protein